MNQDARDLWTRAVRSHTTSAKLAEEDPDSAASRAYYAAFYAVSAWFALQGKTFTKHRALEAAGRRYRPRVLVPLHSKSKTSPQPARLRPPRDTAGEIVLDRGFMLRRH